MIRALRQAARGLLRRPEFTAVAVLSLALGIGANAAVFSAVQAVFLRSVPVRDPGRLMVLFATIEGVPGTFFVSYPNFVDYRDSNTVFSHLVSATPVALGLSGDGPPQRLGGEMVSGDYFETLGVQPALGRAFAADEDRQGDARAVVVLGDSLWRRRFGADRGVIGRKIELNGHPFTVIGVGPRGFTGTGGLTRTDFWVPLALHDTVLPRRFRPFFQSRRATMLGVVGRIKDRVARGQVEAELRTITARLARDYPDTNTGKGLRLIPLSEVRIDPDQKDVYVRAGVLLSAVVGLVLLVACGNVANMLLARAAGRRREIAVRLALGARRDQLVRQLLLEGALLALAAGAAGLLFAAFLLRVIGAFDSPYLPADLELGLDPPVLLYTLVLSLLTVLLFALVPALQATRPDLVTALKEANAPAPRRLELRGLLVVGQVALALISLVSASLFLLSLGKAQKLDPGFERRNLVVASFDLDDRGYDEARGRAFLRRLEERVAALPGVRSAGVAESLVLADQALRRTISPEGQEPDPARPLILQPNAVSPRYFQTMGVRLLRGRLLTENDRPGTPSVAVINRTMAETLWPGIDPVGRRFSMMPTKEIVEVVGEVEDLHYNSLSEGPQLYAYFPLEQHYSSAVTLHVRTAGDPAALIAPVRREIQAEEPGLALDRIRTMEDVVGELLWAPRAGAALLALFGVLALALAVIGIYGVISYSVAQRRREISIRLAIGAGRGQVLRLFVRRGMVLVAVGIGLGLLVAFAAARWIASLLYGVEPGNAAAFAAAALALAAVALVATWLPARRAAAVPPMLAMRQESSS